MKSSKPRCPALLAAVFILSASAFSDVGGTRSVDQTGTAAGSSPSSSSTSTAVTPITPNSSANQDPYAQSKDLNGRVVTEDQGGRNQAGTVPPGAIDNRDGSGMPGTAGGVIDSGTGFNAGASGGASPGNVPGITGGSTSAITGGGAAGR